MTSDEAADRNGSEENVPMRNEAAVAGAVESAGAALLDLGKRDPTLAGQLARLVAAVAGEAVRSGRLARSLTAALAVPEEVASGASGPARSRTIGAPVGGHAGRTRLNRRKPGPWDPFEVFADVGADGLRARLMQLDLEQLRDIVAEHGMDADKLAMKWKDASRVAERIVDRVASRSEKGSAFRGGD